MKNHPRRDSNEPNDPIEPELRRSNRTRRQPKNDDYFMGTTHIEQLLGTSYYEDDCYPKRRRRNHRFDDSDDYSDGHKYSKKNKLTHSNRVERLLQWKLQLYMHPITVHHLPEQNKITPVEELYRVRFTKNLAQENLLTLAEDVEAVFINIDWGKKGQTLKDLQQVRLQNNRLMPKGLVFIWAPKDMVADVLALMEKKDFLYVENFEIINFDFEKAKELAFGPQKPRMTGEQYCQDIWGVVKNIGHVNPCDLIADQPSSLFNRSKRTLLMFKKNNNLKFQLRHQRTCDVVFDMPLKRGEKCSHDLKSYIYNMIETLLPDCLVVQQTGKKEFGFKMLQLWADKDQYRRGWISVVQE